MAMYADEYSDPYEARKQKAPTRPGAAPAPAPAAPTNFPPPPTPTGGYTGRGAAPAPAPAPAPTGPPPGEDFNSWFQRANAAGGGNFDPNSAESKAQYEQHLATLRDPSQGGGMGQNAEYAGSGDPTGLRAYAKQQGMSEDYPRFSNAALATWKKDSSCPPNKPFRSYTDNSCQEKPIDSDTPQGGGGAGGGVGGGGGAAAGAPAGGGDASGLSGQMEGVLKGMLAGGTSRYSPEAMQGLL